MITLYQFRPALGLPNASPFCMKLETYLRMAGLSYQTQTVLRSRASTGKTPYVALDGEIVGDSTRIIARLEAANGHPVDGRLTLAQRGESLAFQRMLEEHLYWATVYMRWVAAPSRDAARLLTALGVPGLVAPLVVWGGRRRYAKVLYDQGLGRHMPDVLWQMGIADLQAMAHWLGTRSFAFGDTPTVLDACLAAFVGNIVRTPWDSPLKTAALKHRSLVDHFTRMLTRYFPEYV